MDTQNGSGRFPKVGDESGLAPADRFYREEVQLANRNRGMPLEGLRYPVTPTGMHYLLIHFDIPYLDAGQWRLKIGGLVNNPRTLTLDDVMKRPAVSMSVTMECAGNGRALLDPRPVSQPWLLEAIGTAEWTGTPLRGILEEAGLKDEAIGILFTGVDRGVQGEEVQYYERSLNVQDATREEVLLVYAMNGCPLEPQHGYPLRLLVPGWYGMTNVKWLHSINAIAETFQGYQMTGSYRYSQSADDSGDPVSLIRVRSLMVPPGIPDFVTRIRLMEAGEVILMGRAWAGRLRVARVEISTDGGEMWSEASLAEPVSPYAWQEWTYKWKAQTGRYILCVRATDSVGTVQPMAQHWSYQGMGNNMAQRVDVIVE
jgi:DMSO/TMAO reductase YedYZ molybdopterin-dependent catalytic subunit